MTPSGYRNRIVEYLQHFIRTLNDFSKYSSLCQNLINHQLNQQKDQTRSRVNLPRLHNSPPPRKLETRDNFLSYQSTPSLQNRVSIQIELYNSIKLKIEFLYKAMNSRTNHVQLPSIGPKNANANQNNQSPRGNSNWAIRSETPPQKRSPTPEVPFNVNNCPLNSTDDTNRRLNERQSCYKNIYL